VLVQERRRTYTGLRHRMIRAASGGSPADLMLG
jgi:hypothetical protein